MEEQKYPEYVHGIKPGTSAQVTPLKHVNMLKRHFSRENIQKAIQHIKTQGETEAPLFQSVDTRGEWSQKEGRLFWLASDGSTPLLQVVPKEEVTDIIHKSWYDQSTPRGIVSLHFPTRSAS